MATKTTELSQLLQAVECLREEVARLGDRLSQVESVAQRVSLADSPKPEPFSEELLATISSAVAAYLGVKAQIRQIQLLRSDAWAQQGRATIQASHAIKVHHG